MFVGNYFQYILVDMIGYLPIKEQLGFLIEFSYNNTIIIDA